MFKKILIVGSDSQIGQHLQICSKKLRIETKPYNRKQLDLTNIRNIEDVVSQIQPDLVINTSAFNCYEKAELNSEQAFTINEIGIENLAKVLAPRGCRVFHISSSSVFDGNSKNPYNEKDSTAPINTLATSKLNGERALHRIIPNATIIRTGWVFSQYRDNFAMSILKESQNNSEITVVDNQYGSPTWAGHIAEAIVKLLEFDDQSKLYGIINFSGWPNASWFDFARAVLQKAKEHGVINKIPKLKPVNVEEKSNAVSYPKNTCLDCTKIQKIIPTLIYRWSDGLKKMMISMSKSNAQKDQSSYQPVNSK